MWDALVQIPSQTGFPRDLNQAPQLLLPQFPLCSVKPGFSETQLHSDELWRTSKLMAASALPPHAAKPELWG